MKGFQLHTPRLRRLEHEAASEWQSSSGKAVLKQAHKQAPPQADACICASEGGRMSSNAQSLELCSLLRTAENSSCSPLGSARSSACTLRGGRRGSPVAAARAPPTRWPLQGTKLPVLGRSAKLHCLQVAAWKQDQYPDTQTPGGAFQLHGTQRGVAPYSRPSPKPNPQDLSAVKRGRGRQRLLTVRNAARARLCKLRVQTRAGKWWAPTPGKHKQAKQTWRPSGAETGSDQAASGLQPPTPAAAR